MNENSNKLKNQNGLVLVVVLILIPVIFVLSYSSISKLTVGERSTTNVVDRNQAFFAAETAIAAAELWMKSGQQPFVSSFQGDVFAVNNGAFRGLIYKNEKSIDQALSSTPEDVIQYDQYLLNPGDGFVNGQVLKNLHKQPVYVIEMMDFSTCTEGMTKTQGLFKVTARGWGVQASTMVTLETFFSLSFICGDLNGSNGGSNGSAVGS